MKVFASRPTHVYSPDYREPTSVAKSLVATYFASRADKSDPDDVVSLGRDEVYVVTFSYILGGWKCQLSTPVPDNMYYEVTYNKEKDEAYLDAYRKQENVLIQHFGEYDPEGGENQPIGWREDGH